MKNANMKTDGGTRRGFDTVRPIYYHNTVRNVNPYFAKTNGGPRTAREERKRMKANKALAALFTVVMLLFCVFLGYYVVSASDIRFRTEDTELSLETSRGRERKQQNEYDEAAAQLPQVRAELAETRPLADAAEQRVADLKAERKELRARKKELEEKAAAVKPDSPAEEDAHE